MTVKEVAAKHGITIQAVGKHCKNGRFVIGGVGYSAINKAGPGAPFAQWEIHEIPRAGGQVAGGLPSSGGVGRAPDPATMKIMRESASLKKTLAQTKLIQQDLSETLAGHFATWGQIAETALVNGFSDVSKRLMCEDISEEQAERINKVLSECLKSSFEELQRECAKSVDALSKLEGM